MQNTHAHTLVKTNLITSDSGNEHVFGEFVSTICVRARYQSGPCLSFCLTLFPPSRARFRHGSPSPSPRVIHTGFMSVSIKTGCNVVEFGVSKLVENSVLDFFGRKRRNAFIHPGRRPIFHFSQTTLVLGLLFSHP